MPISKHYKGEGKKVMASMKETYDDPATAERVFYATENKQKKQSKVRAAIKRTMSKK